MSFTAGIPASGQSLGSSRTQVLNNFSVLRSTISNVIQPNHIDVNNTGAGKHIFVQMPVQVSGAANLPAAQEGGLITKTASGASELFYARDAVNAYLQMTGPLFTGQGTNSVGGTTMLFGGIILKWGIGSGVTSFLTQCGSVFPNNCFVVVSNLAASAVSPTGFTINGGAYFIAIGN